MNWLRKHFWLSMALASVISLAVGGYLGRDTRPGSDYGLSSASWMPEGASNGAFADYGSAIIFGSPVFLREFDISEAAFIRYAQGKGITLSEIGKPELARRYYALAIPEKDLRFKSDDPAASLQAYRDFTSIRVSKGLVYFHQFEDQLQHYVYDRERGRAFIEIHTR